MNGDSYVLNVSKKVKIAENNLNAALFDLGQNNNGGIWIEFEDGQCRKLVPGTEIKIYCYQAWAINDEDL